MFLLRYDGGCRVGVVVCLPNCCTTGVVVVSYTCWEEEENATVILKYWYVIPEYRTESIRQNY